MWTKKLSGYCRAVVFGALLCSTASYAQITISDYEFDATIQTYNTSLIQPFITALKSFIDLVDEHPPVSEVKKDDWTMTVRERIQQSMDRATYFRARLGNSPQYSDPEWTELFESLRYRLGVLRTKLEAQRDADVISPSGLWTNYVTNSMDETSVWLILTELYSIGKKQCSPTACDAKSIVAWLFSGWYDPAVGRWQLSDEDLAIRVGVLKLLVKTIEDTREKAISRMDEFLEEYGSKLGIDFSSIDNSRKSFIQPQSPAALPNFEYAGRQPHRQSHGQIPAYLAQQSAQYCPTPQSNSYAFSNAFNSPSLGGPGSPGPNQMPATPGFTPMQAVIPMDYPTPGVTPASTPRYVLPSVVANQLEGESSGMPTVVRQNQQPLPPPPPPPPQLLPMQPAIIPLNTEQTFTLSDKEWQEALQAQQEHEWQMHMQRQIATIQEQQQRDQQARIAARVITNIDENNEDGDTFDEESFYDLSGSRRNTYATISNDSHRASGASALRDSVAQTLQNTRAIPPRKPSPEEDFYNSVNTIRSSTKPSQFTPNSDTPGGLDESHKPQPFSVDILSTNSYPVPTPLPASDRIREATSISFIENRFPNWYVDSSSLRESEGDDNAHGPLAKRRRTVGDSQTEGEQFWGVFYDHSGQWSRMWNRFTDGIFDYYHRMHCRDKQGLDPQTLGQLWEDMGYPVEENLYESQMRLAQSLFHPDPEDFISSLLTNYFTLLSLPHVLEQPPVQPPPSFLPKCVNPEPPVPIPILTRDGLKRYFAHQTLLDPAVMHERFNNLLKNKSAGIVDPETSLPFVHRETGGPFITRLSFPHCEDAQVEEIEERVRGWMRSWVKSQVDGWVGPNGQRLQQPEGMI
ncbi:hypothetical protein Dda_1608 [Drechslerella dactyloides]|uniref:DUF7514 domain-containing protein n=1 Tax=Drechslerella dactyloides TaxID=74499 RepID=A0AAD6NLK1_DREDA|nr:hypothetical protein Dda_1608 [Drechslerella dactyloides]